MAEATYFAGILASVAGANKHHLAIHNNNANLKVKVLKVIATGAPIAAVAGLVIPLHAARFTGAAPGGNAVTPLAAAASDAPVPAGITARAIATGVTGEETVPFGIGTVSGEETASASRCVLYEFAIDGSRPIELAQGQGITVKQGALASAGAVHVCVHFTVV